MWVYLYPDIVHAALLTGALQCTGYCNVMLLIMSALSAVEWKYCTVGYIVAVQAL